MVMRYLSLCNTQVEKGTGLWLLIGPDSRIRPRSNLLVHLDQQKQKQYLHNISLQGKLCNQI